MIKFNKKIKSFLSRYISLFLTVNINYILDIFMKKIFILFFLSIIFWSFNAQIKIPTNSPENTRVSNWIVAKVSDFQEKQIESFLNNPLDFYNNAPSKNVKELNLSDYSDVSIALYQLYREIDYKTMFMANCEIESNNDQLCGFEFRDMHMDATLYINDIKVLNSTGGSEWNFDYKLKKGKNKVSLIGKPSGKFLSSFFLNIYNQSYGKVTLSLKDEKSSYDIPYSRITLNQDNISKTFKPGKDDQGTFWLKPGNYIFKGSSVSPSYFTSTQLSGFSVPQDTTTPTYALSASASSMNEGGNATLFLTTTNVGDTTAVPYTITGISINDLVNGSLTGSFIVQNNSASLTLNLNADSLTEGAEALTLSLNNGAATISVTINDNSTGTVSYYHDPHWYNEFSASFLANIPKSEAVNVADQFREYFYEGTGAFTNTLGQVRYALNRRPDAAGMAYWVGQWYNTYSSDAVASVPNDPNWTAFTKVFFTSVDASTSPIPFTVDGVALTGSANSDAARSLLATKNSIQGDGVGYYGDRGSLTGNQQQPSPPSATFAFTVTPATGMNFNVAEEQGVVNFSYTITCTAGSGSVTVQELTRPSNIPVRVDDSYSPGYPNQTTSAVATKSTGTMVAGSTRQLQLGIYPGAKGTWSGSFVFLESTGVGQNIQRGWGGTFT